MLSRLKSAVSRVKYAFGGWFAEQVAPRVDANTFFVWEPCSHSHTEVVPGFARYLRDLGFDVTVCISDDPENLGLFSRIDDARITVLRRPQAAFLRYFRRHGLGQARGMLMTTARKIGHKDDYDSEQQLFARRSPEQALLLVEHDVRRTTDLGTMRPDVITLAPVQYAAAESTVVNPHYFGPVRLRAKHPDVVRFVAVGALRARRRNSNMLIEAVDELHRQGVRNFRIAIIGSGKPETIPQDLRPYFELRGRTDFTGLYREIDAADFILALLDPDNPQHERYLTTGTSGTFQLVYGFCKPCLIAAKFAAAHGLNAENSIVYPGNAALAQALSRAIALPAPLYAAQQQALQALAGSIEARSLANLRGLISPDAQRSAGKAPSTLQGSVA